MGKLHCLAFFMATLPFIVWPGIHDYAGLPQRCYLGFWAITFAAIGACACIARRKAPSWPLKPETVLLFSVLSYSWLSALWGINIIEALSVCLLWTTAGAVFVYTSMAVETCQEHDVLEFPKWFLLAGAGMGLLVIVQKLYGVQTPIIPQSVIPAGTLGNKNVAAELLAALFPLALTGNGYVLAIIAGGMIATMSRASIFSLALGISVALAHRSSRGIKSAWLLVAGAALVFCVLFASRTLEQVPHERDSTVYLRLALGANGMAMIWDHPLNGIGIGQTQTYYPKYKAAVIPDLAFKEGTQPKSLHNEYIQGFAELGIIGFILVMSLVGCVFIKAGEVYAHAEKSYRSDYAVLTMAVEAGAFTILLNAALSFPMHIPSTVALLAIYGGTICGLHKRFLLGRRFAPTPSRASIT